MLWSLLPALTFTLGIYGLPSEFGLNGALEPRWSKDEYVQAQGTKLMNKDKEYFVSGFNYYSCMCVGSVPCATL